VILVSASGVLSPGPLFFINIIYGSKQGVTGGIKIAFGHTIVDICSYEIYCLSFSCFCTRIIISSLLRLD
ncbi:MAG: hypothetical protein WBF33_27960, partial [Candidatus Nitrosopolaris sp.]